MKILVCGSRDFADLSGVSLAIDARIARLAGQVHVIHGAARGVDMIAAESASRYGHEVQAFPADWKTHGNRAGLVRNLAMLDEKPDLVIAFWNGKSTGTAHTITNAKKRGIPVEVIVE